MSETTTIHQTASTSEQEAAATRVPRRIWAKVVVCLVDGEAVEAVVPEPLMINLNRLLELAGGGAIRLADEGEVRQLFPGRDSGAIPPLGPWYSQTVFVDVAIAAEPEIVFSGETHEDASAIRWCDFARSVRPIVGRFAGPRRDRVPAYHLSYRE